MQPTRRGESVWSTPDLPRRRHITFPDIFELAVKNRQEPDPTNTLGIGGRNQHRKSTRSVKRGVTGLGLWAPVGSSRRPSEKVLPPIAKPRSERKRRIHNALIAYYLQFEA